LEKLGNLQGETLGILSPFVAMEINEQIHPVIRSINTMPLRSMENLQKTN
jgi:hypothetical protein